MTRARASTARLIDQTGASMVEYALLIALIALAVVFAVTLLGSRLPGLFEPVSDTLA